MRNWYEENHGKQSHQGFMRAIVNATKDRTRDDILFIIHKYFLQRGYIRIINKIDDCINWTDERKEEIWKTCNTYKKFDYLPSNVNWEDRKEEIFEWWKSRIGMGHLPLGINWEDKKEEIWEICKSYKDFHYLPSNVNWEDRKEEIFERWKSCGGIFYLPSSVNWEDKKEEIWEICKSYKDFHYLPSNVNWEDRKEEIFEWWKSSKGMGSLPLGINWEDKKEEIWEICDTYKGWNDLPSNVDWTDKKYILLFGEDKQLYFDEYINIVSNYIKWDDYQEVYTIMKSLREYNFEHTNQVEKALQKNNPIYNQAILKSLNFDKCPWLTDDPEKLTDVNVEDEKAFLIEIFDRLDKIGSIDNGIMLEEENLSKYLGYTEVDREQFKNQLKLQINNLSDKAEITVLLAFYLNKLTKVNKMTMYARALGNFSYNEEFEQIIASNEGKNLPPNVGKYKDEKERAQEKGNIIISTLKYLRGDNSNPKAKGDKNDEDKVRNCDSYAFLISQAQNSQKDNLSSYSFPMKSFSEFLEYWKTNRDENGCFKIEENSRLREFCEAFNNNIKDLQDRGCTLDEITNSFIYGSQALDLEDKLYEVKICLLQQIIEYSKKDEYKDKLMVQYGKDKPLGFEEIFKLWQNDKNRDEKGKFKKDFNANHLSSKVLKKFNEEIENMVKEGFSVDKIKNRISKKSERFQQFKNAIEKFQEEAIDSKTRNYLFVTMDNLVFPMSFHTNIELLQGVKEFLRKVHKDEADFARQESINIPCFLDSDMQSKLNDRKKEKEIDTIFKKSIFFSNIRNISQNDKFKEHKEEFDEFVKDAVNYIGIVPDSKKSLVEQLQEFINDNLSNSNMEKKVLTAKVASFIIQREKIPWNPNDDICKDFKRSREELQKIINQELNEFDGKYEFVWMPFADKKRYLGIAENISEQQKTEESNKRISESDFSDLLPGFKNMIEKAIKEGTSLEILESNGISGKLLEYAKFCEEKKSKDDSKTDVRPDAKASREMTVDVKASDIKAVEKQISSSIGKEAEKTECHEEGQGDSYGE